jgi:DNA-binding MarR family transcriptional regulator
VEKGQRDRRTNYYSLTRRGNREIKARQDWEAQYIGEEADELTAD